MKGRGRGVGGAGGGLRVERVREGELGRCEESVGYEGQLGGRRAGSA